MRRLALALLGAAVLAGCFTPGQREAPRYHVLEARGGAPKAKAPRPLTLRVAPTSAASFYDTQAIVYSRAAGERGYYQISRWTERPSRRVHALLVERLRESGAFQTVIGVPGGLRDDLVLATHLEEMVHDATSRPGTVRIALEAVLTDPAKRTLIARRSFTRETSAASYDAAGAVAGFNQAVSALLNDVVAWVDATLP